MSNWVKLLLLVIVVAILAAVYFIFDPNVSSWFPKCVFHQLTGLDCPTCGTQRAVHAILHGEFLAALRVNPFIVISIPYGICLFFILIFKTSFTRKMRAILLHRYVVYTYCVIFVGWWILRNLI